MRSYLLIVKLLRRYNFFLVVAVLLSFLVSAFQGIGFLSILPFWSRIVEGDPFVFNLSVNLPTKLQTLVDNFTVWVNNIPSRQFLFMLAFFVVLVTILRSLIIFLSDVTLRFVGHRVVRDVRSRLYAHLHSLSLDYFSEKRTGELMSRITNDAEVLSHGVSEGAETLLRNIFDLAVFITLPILIFWRLALIVFGLFVIMMPPIVIIGNVIRKLSSHSQEKIADITSMLQETLSGVRVVKAFCMEEYEKKRFDSYNNRFYRLMMSMAFRDAFLSPVTEVVVVLSSAVVFIVMGQYILARQIDSAQFLIYMVCLAAIPRPVKLVSRANNMIQKSAAAAERIVQILNIESTVQEKPGAIELPAIQNWVRFVNVGFSYNGKDTVLTNIDLEVRRGEVVAIVGASGVGKSTLVNLIPRFYDPVSGQIEIDGHDIRGVTIKSLRAQVGLVTQEVILFNDTVAGNISYGKKGTEPEKIVEAARSSNAYDFIMNLPHKFETMIGERGYLLSGGERQRLAIARAILKDPPILILDEATSALDAESEKLVQEAIVRLMTNRTVFVIAHRLSTIRHADRIVVLENKGIAQIGKHEELIAVDGPYHRLYEMQFQV